MKSFLAAALTLWALVYAHPAFAQFSTVRDASIGFAEGNQSGNVVLTLNGASEAVVQNMTFDADAGRWVGFGRVDYDGNGVSVHVSGAAFSVRIEDFDPPAGCTTPVGSPAFAAHIEARDSGGNLILVAGNPVEDDSAPCPQWQLTANVGANLPATLALLKPRYRDGAIHAPAQPSLGKVKAGYMRQINGRIIRTG